MTPVSRRRFVQGAGVAGLGLLTGCGRLPLQPPPPTPLKVYRVGFLFATDPATNARVLDVFRQGLGKMGYLEGQNLVVEYRWSDGDTRRAELAAELIHLPVDVIVVPGAIMARTVRAATTTVPIVQAGGNDPVTEGFATSHARPGGNVTGLIGTPPELDGKRLQLLKEAAPAISRVAILQSAGALFPAATWVRHAQTVGVGVDPLGPRGPGEIDEAVEEAARKGADALLVPQNPLANAHRQEIIQLAARLRWPAIYYRREWVDEGGLMAYEANQDDLWRRAAAHVDKILQGAAPADIPIEQPMLFDFRINLKSAQTLNLSIPQHVLLQATEVLQ